jgi:hypothetical protein
MPVSCAALSGYAASKIPACADLQTFHVNFRDQLHHAAIAVIGRFNMFLDLKLELCTVHGESRMKDMTGRAKKQAAACHGAAVTDFTLSGGSIVG